MRVISFLFACFFAFSAFGEELNATVDKNLLTEGDTVTLTLEYDGNSDSSPELDELQKNFKIITNYTSRNVSYINGNFSQIKKWRIGLQPLKVGKISIKPIKLGNLKSNYIDIEVKPVSDVALVPDSRENTNSPYFKIEQTITPTTPYQQQQTTLVVTLYDSVGLQNGTFSLDEETKKDWVILPLMDKPITERKNIDGKYMNVRTFMFAAFPQKSGELSVPQMMFDGFYVKNVNLWGNDFNDDFNVFGMNFNSILGQQVPIKMRAKSQNILVKPIPQNVNTSVWLPLKNLTLASEKNKQSTYNVGDAISRKIKIMAVGIPEINFPTVELPEVTGFKQYPEKPILNENIVNGEIITTAEINTVYIPYEEGDFIFPKIEIEWFNLITQNFEKAILPAENIKINKNSFLQQNEAKNSSSLIDSSDTDLVKNIPNSEETTNLIDDNTKKMNLKNYKKTPFIWWILIGGIILLLVGIAFTKKIINKGTNLYRNSVINYIYKSDYHSAKSAILNWAIVKFGNSDIKNFNDITDIVKDDEFKKQLNALNKQIYAANCDDFNEKEFIDIFKKVDRTKRKIDKNKTILPNLYN